MRFNYDANTIDEAKAYIKNRAKQLLKFGYILSGMEAYDWGIDATFKMDDKEYQSLYILNDFRGKGIYPTKVNKKILTSYECNLHPYLTKNKIPFVCVTIVDTDEYEIMESRYGDNKTKRSDQYLINHIDEGLSILNTIGASDLAKKAYTVHPIYQSDEDLIKILLEWNDYGYVPLDNMTTLLAMEYRSVANNYLSTRTIDSIDDIRLSPLKDVNDMLIADKVQNYKDFILYHQDTHPRSKELYLYFHNWFKKLNINADRLTDLLKLIS